MTTVLTRWQRFLHDTLDLHWWVEFVFRKPSGYEEQRRACLVCDKEEYLLFVPAAPGAFESWEGVE